ncbi:ubiquinone biosynthesis protein UbiB [bacterium]|nr:ubiquinone biosynthesis protein UbiB [bacterium]
MRAAAVLARHDVVAPEAIRSRAPWPLKAAGALLRLTPASGSRGRRPAERLAAALERLGPAWIKLGQFLATRPDVIGVEAATDLSRLKDQLAPFPEREARRALETEFGDEAAALFPQLGPAIAAASVAQVHRIRTPEGERAVKILRPGVERMIEVELRAMRRAAGLAEASGHPEAARMEPVQFVETMARSLSREMDLRLEAGAASEFAEIAAIDGFVHAPAVDWARTGRRVLTTEWISGRSLTDAGALAGVDRADLANRITRGFLATALDHGFFHADLHEGNMILADDGRLVLVDFGIMGRIGPPERRFLAEILAGFLKRDYRRVSEVHFEAGYVPQGQSVDDFAQALRSVGEPIFGRAAEEVSMARVLLQLFDITHQFGMHLRPELILLQKTMVQVEGVARTVDPAHNIWQAADPIVSRWTGRQFGPEGLKTLAMNVIRDGAKRLRDAPALLDRLEAIAHAASAPPPPAPKPRSNGPVALLWFGVGVVVAGLSAAALWGWFGR